MSSEKNEAMHPYLERRGHGHGHRRVAASVGSRRNFTASRGHLPPPPPAGRCVDRKRKEENVRLLLQKGTAECAVQPSQKVTPQKERN